MAKDVKILCPLMGGKPCIEDGSIVNGELVGCKFWVELIGKHPQTGVDMKGGDCTISWLPVLLINNAKETAAAGAAVESFRNEMVKAADNMTTNLIGAAPAMKVIENG